MDEPQAPQRPLPPFHEIGAAAVFLTRLPIPQPEDMAPDLPARAMAWYPLVGAVLGLLGGLVHAFAMGIGLTPLLAALLALAALVLVTGALHEDGLADVVDGFGGGRDRDHKLAIMRDSRLGAFGALALIFSLALRAAAIMALEAPAAVIAALIAGAALSRAVLPAVGAYLPSARPGGLGDRFGRPSGLRAVIAAVLGAVIAGLVLGAAALPCIAVAILAALGMAGLAERQIGGQTGDVLGATQQVTEIAILLTLIVLA